MKFIRIELRKKTIVETKIQAIISKIIPNIFHTQFTTVRLLKDQIIKNSFKSEMKIIKLIET